MTAKQELLEIVEGLSEEAAERVLPVAKREAETELPAGNAGRLLALLEKWHAEAEPITDDEARAYDEMLANLEPVRFRLAGEW